MVQNATGTIFGADLSEMAGVSFGTIIIETRDGDRMKFQITKDTEGSVPPIGSIISVVYVGDEMFRAVKIRTVQASGERRNPFFGLPSSRNNSQGTALERGLYDMVVIVILQSIIALGFMIIGLQPFVMSIADWFPYLYLAMGIFHLIIAVGLFLMQSWAYAASLTVTLLTSAFLIMNVIFLIPALLVVVYLMREQVRNYYE